MQIVSFDRWYSTGHCTYCIPTNLDSALPKPKGYIRDMPIDDYENSCVHIEYQSVSYDAGGKPVTFHINYPGVDRQCWRYNCICFSQWYSWRNMWGNAVYVHYGYTIEAYGCDTMEPVIEEVPNFLKQKELQVWLLNHGYRYLWSQNSSSGFSVLNVSRVHCTQNDIDDLTAEIVESQFFSDNALEPNASTAFFSACSELKFNSNSVANAAEIVDICKSLVSTSKAVKKASKSLSKRAADAWLKYRYCYNTTKADVSELRRYSEQMGNDSGTLRTSFSAGTATGNLKIRYQPTANTMLRKLLGGMSSLQRLGLDPSLYNLWDMIPFSFIADWFIPIGDNLERISNMKWAATMPYDVECLASLKGTVTVGGQVYRVYTRFRYSPSYEFCWIPKGDTQVSSWTKRGLDVIALTRS